jgi:hypothetical protein
MVRKERDCCGQHRRKVKRGVWYHLFSLLPLTGMAGLLLLVMVMILIPSCQALQNSGGPVETSRDSRLPAALRG